MHRALKSAKSARAKFANLSNLAEKTTQHIFCEFVGIFVNIYILSIFATHTLMSKYKYYCCTKKCMNICNFTEFSNYIYISLYLILLSTITLFLSLSLSLLRSFTDTSYYLSTPFHSHFMSLTHSLSHTHSLSFFVIASRSSTDIKFLSFPFHFNFLPLTNSLSHTQLASLSLQWLNLRSFSLSLSVTHSLSITQSHSLSFFVVAEWKCGCFATNYEGI